jgi:glycosyltransferase involved in cell wall biosynthesis
MVSIIIVVYNASKYLKYAIESVLEQTYNNYEIIAIDDGSTDSTFDILNEYTYLSNLLYFKRTFQKS